MTVPATDPLIGHLIDGRYQVRSRIARGGMATVYVANDLRLDRRVAIKIMHGHLADDAVFRERFVQEARSAARLAHPNVVSVFDQGEDQEMAYLVMEYLPGMTLRQLLKEQGTLTVEQTLEIMRAVLGGLASAHRAGIVHRDVKPENVLLADDGRIKIGDFGLARAATSNTATGQALLGTIAYLSPELLTRGVADARSDVYASGIMMYEMLVGEQPYRGEQPMQIAYQHANENVPAPSARVQSVPADVDELVEWAAARRPEDRPADAGVLLDRLIEVQQSVDQPRLETVGMLRTAVLPPLRTDSGDQTLVLGAPPRTGATALLFDPREDESQSPTSPTDELRTAATKRRRRAPWIVLVVLLLAALAGGATWFFTLGPAGMVSVQDVAGQSPDAAEAALVDQGFVVSRAEQTSPTVVAGTVIATDPPAQSSIQRGSPVALIVSRGPAMLPVPAVAGQPEADARAALTAVPFTVTASALQFSDDIARGAVIAALGADGQPLGAEYGEQQPVSLVVSAGSVPSVAGLTPAEAKSALNAVNLNAVDGEQVYSDDVAAGIVIAGTNSAETMRPGDTVTLTISRGPEPVAVPSVVGMTRDQAKRELEAVGLVPVYSAFWDAIPNGLTRVQSASPEPGASVPKGSSINLAITAGG